MQESELYGLLATAKSLQIKGLTDSDDNSGIGDERAAGPSFWSERERERQEESIALENSHVYGVLYQLTNYRVTMVICH